MFGQRKTLTEHRDPFNGLFHKSRFSRVLLQFDDGWEWWSERSEAILGPNAFLKDQACLLLMQPAEESWKGVNDWKVRAIATLNSEHEITDLRGFGMTKPSSELHPYILDLLLLPTVEKVAGPGYSGGPSQRPNNSFNLSQLNSEDYAFLHAKKPSLFGSFDTSSEMDSEMDSFSESYDFVAGIIGKKTLMEWRPGMKRYSRLCPQCGSDALVSDGYDVHCRDCGDDFSQRPMRTGAPVRRFGSGGETELWLNDKMPELIAKATSKPSSKPARKKYTRFRLGSNWKKLPSFAAKPVSKVYPPTWGPDESMPSIICRALVT